MSHRSLERFDFLYKEILNSILFGSIYLVSRSYLDITHLQPNKLGRGHPKTFYNGPIFRPVNIYGPPAFGLSNLHMSYELAFLSGRYRMAQ